MTARPTFRSEAGYAVPGVLLMMIAALSIATAIAFSSISAQKGTSRDEQQKTSLAVAESGFADAMTRYNSFATSNGQPCVIVTGGGSLAGSATSAGWCNPVNGTSSGGTYSYQVRPTVDTSSHLTSRIEVVATGTVNGVKRRVHVIADSAPGTRVFCDSTGTVCHGVKTQNGITMDSNAEMHAGSATNGSINLAANAKICSYAQVGLGQHLVLTGNAGYFSDTNCTQPTSSFTQAPLTLPPFNQGDAATNNDNQRITNAAAGTGSPADLVSGNRNNVTWSSGTRQLTLKSNTGLTLTGSKYSLCKLTMNSNTILSVATGQQARIYFDSPEACNLSSPATQVSMSSNSRLTPVSGVPKDMAMYFVGSKDRVTRANFSSNTQVGPACESNFVLYAPLTDVTMNSNATYCGAVASKTLHMDSNARIYTDADSQNFRLDPTGSHFATSQFVECSALPPAGATSPDSGC